MLNIDDLVVDKEFEELLPVLTPEEFERLEQNEKCYEADSNR